MQLIIPTTPSHGHYLSSSSSTAMNSPLTLLPRLSSLSLSVSHRPPSTLIRMGGGPRTFPGGVSKWQWKRMQLKKAKQLLQARLARERHIYEMRKRAELKAAVSELERPWEVIQKAAPRSSGLFSVGADEQLKVLADRFQKPGGFDMWSDNDGPQIFMTPDEGLPTARFFPKGVVHSIRPYERIDHGNVGDSSRAKSLQLKGPNSEDRTGSIKRKNGHRKRIGSTSSDATNMQSDNGNSQNLKLSSNGENMSDRKGDNWSGGVSRMNGDQKRFDTLNESGRKSMSSRQGRRGKGLDGGSTNSNITRDGSKWSSRGKNSGRARDMNSEDVYDMSLQDDGTYGFRGRDQDSRLGSRVYKQKMIKSYLSERNKGR